MALEDLPAPLEPGQARIIHELGQGGVRGILLGDAAVRAHARKAGLQFPVPLRYGERGKEYTAVDPEAENLANLRTTLTGLLDHGWVKRVDEDELEVLLRDGAGRVIVFPSEGLPLIFMHRPQTPYAELLKESTPMSVGGVYPRGVPDESSHAQDPPIEGNVAFPVASLRGVLNTAYHEHTTRAAAELIRAIAAQEGASGGARRGRTAGASPTHPGRFGTPGTSDPRSGRGGAGIGT